MNFPDMQSCVCGNLRRTTRVITQFYDHYLQPTGLRSTQCALLRSISLHKNSSIGELAELLLMDQSTVTRNIEILKKNSYITSTPSEYDARIKVISITSLGEKKLEEAMPLWEQAQLEIKAKLGAQFTEFINTLQSINKYVK